MTHKTRTALLVFFLLATIASFGYVTYDFPGWSELVGGSPYVLIVQCSKAPESPRAVDGVSYDNPIKGGRLGGITMSDVKIVSVLKGTNVEAGTSVTLYSELRPYPGDMYAIFPVSLQGNNCQCFELYRVISLGSHFSMNIIEGKSLEEQVATLRQYRLDFVNKELNQGMEEKRRLEEGMKTK